MIKYINDCLIEGFKTGRYIAMCHQANCQNTMGSGVAKDIKRHFPEAYAADCYTNRGDRRKMGGFTKAMTSHGLIFNLYGQFHYGYDGQKYTELDKLEEAVQNMAIWLQGNASFNNRICMPKMGCGRGGADWETEVLPIIERQLIARGFEVDVYEKAE